MSRADLIEQWFSEHGGEDDFSLYDPLNAFKIIGPREGHTKIFYCTKGSVVFRAAEQLTKPINFGLISRFGLPGNTDIAWLRDLIESRELLFIGDMDPVDVLTFAWIRESLQSTRVTHVGINDQYISRLGVNLPIDFRIALGPAEMAAVSILEELIPDVRTVLGTKCLDILYEGYKIELEAIVSAIGRASPLLTVALDA